MLFIVYHSFLDWLFNDEMPRRNILYVLCKPLLIVFMVAKTMRWNICHAVRLQPPRATRNDERWWQKWWCACKTLSLHPRVFVLFVASVTVMRRKKGCRREVLLRARANPWCMVYCWADATRIKCTHACWQRDISEKIFRRALHLSILSQQSFATCIKRKIKYFWVKVQNLFGCRLQSSEMTHGSEIKRLLQKILSKFFGSKSRTVCIHFS